MEKNVSVSDTGRQNILKALYAWEKLVFVEKIMSRESKGNYFKK